MAIPHQAQPVVVVERKSRKGAALIAAGAAIALLGGAGSFALLSETHVVTQNVTAGGELKLEITGGDGVHVHGDTVALPLWDGALPGESQSTVVTVQNIGDVAANISLHLDGSVATEDDGVSDALANLVDVTVDGGDGVLLSGTVADLAGTPVEKLDVLVLDAGEADSDGDTLTLTITVEIDRDASDSWAGAARGEVSAIITITGDQVTDQGDANQ